MASLHTSQCRLRLPRGPVDERAAAQRRLNVAFERLRTVLAGRQKRALRGVSAQYISAVLNRETPASLERFVELVTSELNRSEQEFVLGALVEEARVSDKPPLVEIAEATEAVGRALGLAERILAEANPGIRERGELREFVHQAERELEDVEVAVAGGGL